MDDLRNKPQKPKRPNKIWLWIKKYKWWLLSITIILLLIIFPSDSGRLIGTWIHNFIGNLINYINL
jgi:hypothetical protein